MTIAAETRGKMRDNPRGERRGKTRGSAYLDPAPALCKRHVVHNQIGGQPPRLFVPVDSPHPFGLIA